MNPRRRMTPEELAAAKEGANRKRRLRRLWAGELTLAEVCEEMGLPEGEVTALAESLGLGEREEPETYVPDPATIRLEAAKIRAGWTDAERESRLARPPGG